MYERELFDFKDMHDDRQDNDNKTEQIVNEYEREDRIQNISKQRKRRKKSIRSKSEEAFNTYTSEEYFTDIKTKILHSIDKITDAIYRLSNTSPEVILSNLNKFEKFFKIISSISFIAKKEDAIELDEMLQKFIDKIDKIR